MMIEETICGLELTRQNITGTRDILRVMVAAAIFHPKSDRQL